MKELNIIYSNNYLKYDTGGDDPVSKNKAPRFLQITGNMFTFHLNYVHTFLNQLINVLLFLEFWHNQPDLAQISDIHLCL